jgi:hypothetical protein
LQCERKEFEEFKGLQEFRIAGGKQPKWRARPMRFKTSVSKIAPVFEGKDFNRRQRSETERNPSYLC